MLSSMWNEKLHNSPHLQPTPHSRIPTAMPAVNRNIHLLPKGDKCCQLCHVVSAPPKPCDSGVTPGWNSTELFIMGCTLHLNFTMSEALLACLLLQSPPGIHLTSNSSTVKANKSWFLSLASKWGHLVLCCAQVRALLPTLGFQQHHSPTPSLIPDGFTLHGTPLLGFFLSVHPSFSW